MISYIISYILLACTCYIGCAHVQDPDLECWCEIGTGLVHDWYDNIDKRHDRNGDEGFQ